MPFATTDSNAFATIFEVSSLITRLIKDGLFSIMKLFCFPIACKMYGLCKFPPLTAALAAFKICNGVVELPCPNDAVASSTLPILLVSNSIPLLSPNKSIPVLLP